ncbi:hypothetical protein ACGFOU_19100 [Streptomyces sp. NPDC048595]|uniref:hypothetical protein n=1 Tax=Streptomyces sp. NPDC048595 TaxID=3365576 RepID=UPI003712DC30
MLPQLLHHVGPSGGTPGLRRLRACELEELGFGTLWLGGVPGGDLHSSLNVLTATRHVVVAPSGVSLWSVPPDRLAHAYCGLPAPYRGRTLVGLAVSHAEIAAAYRRPCTAMSAYLDALDTSAGSLPKPARILGAHRPLMTRLAVDGAAAVQPYLLPPSHTARARTALGADHVALQIVTDIPYAVPLAAWRAVAESLPHG